MKVLLLFRYGETNRSEDDCHGENSILVTNPKRKGLCRAIKGNTNIGQKADGDRGRHRPGPLMWFQQVKQSKKA